MTDAPSAPPSARTAQDAFARRFGRPARFVAVAPGRVNLIGEHTDYNDGFVFPMAIDRHTAVAGALAPAATTAAEGRRVRIVSANLPDEAIIPIRADLQPEAPAWANYVRGVIVGFLELGLELPSLDLAVASDLPIGAGLSSSAALEVAVATAFEAALRTSLDPMIKARLCQEAENRLAGVPCGIMDQATACLALAGSLLLIDCGDETIRAVALADELSVIITDSGVQHAHSDGSYAQRRAECAAAAHALGITSLRATSPAAVEAAQGRIDPLLLRRALHVVSENVRTLATAGALLRNEPSVAGDLMYASHRSLRDDFAVSCPELDGLVEIARGIGPAGGVLGARLTGGGFGGATVTLVQTAKADQVMDGLRTGYQQRFGRAVTPFVARPTRGAHVLDAP
ncbi:MAG TPA: galactokinase [Polyangia bacterium]